MCRILGNLKDNESVFVCECGCVFAYKDEDVKKETEIEVDYWGSSRWEVKHLTCPECGKDLEVK